MGREAKSTTITIDGRAHAGDALLETDELFLRVAGEPKRRKLALRDLRNVRGAALTLSFEHDEHRYALEVEDGAGWAERITSPPTLLDKLGIARGSRVHVAGLDDEAEFDAALRAARVVRVPLGPGAGVVVRGISTSSELRLLKQIRRAVGDALALWVVYPKGRKDPGEDDMRAAAIAEGLVDVKVARFSAARSALKLVVRKSERGPR